MKRRILLTMLLALSEATHSQGQAFFDGYGLASLCQSTEIIDLSGCAGYIAAAADMHEVFVANGVMAELWCAPVGVSADELMQVVTIFLDSQSGNLGAAAGTFIAAAFMEAFPCE